MPRGIQHPKKDTILFLALNMAGKSIFTPPRFFLSAGYSVTVPYKEISGGGRVQNLRIIFRKVFRTMNYVQKSCQKRGSKIFSVFSNLALTFHLRMLSVNGLQNSISQPILHPKRGSCLLLASWIPLGIYTLCGIDQGRGQRLRVAGGVRTWRGSRSALKVNGG